ncbi:MAG: DNA methyltransferase, partial [Campylobacterota bacterium]|nr:DNA methyltransferase [Campylobacterota bacterium]
MGFYLSDLRTKEDLKKIVIERWNYNPNISDFPHDFNEEIKEKIKDTEILAEYADFEIVFFQLSEDDERILRKTEKEIIKQIPTAYKNQYLYVFSSKNGDYWHFCNTDSYKTVLKLKRFVITPDNRENLRTPSERLDKLRIEPDKDKNLEDVKRKVEEAFSVDVITKQFYEKYKVIFNDLKNCLNDQKSDLNSAHHYAHQLLNRIMFLYFVQKRNCFGNDKNFLKTFWNAYKDDFYGENEFHKKWLEVLFFEALNQKKSDYKGKSYFELKDHNFNRILREAPYLNGGLFRKNEWDRTGYETEDEIFDEIFGFFEGYNFTVQESTLLDQDLAIDPEMLGNIYEMVIASENDERHKAGIFYTPKLEIELMIRRSIVEYLYNKTKIDKKRLYFYVFKEHGEEWEPDFSKEEQEKLLNGLNNLKLVDPACGSGHYLVVAAQILYELKEIIYQLEGKSLDKFEEKKRIVERSIFGVDIKEWAAEIAKMRLWLDLFVDAEEEKLKDSQEPLLPSLSFKVRVGDSLVQKLGKEMLPLKQLAKSFPKYKNDIGYVTREKVLAYQNRCDSKKVINDERKLIGDILIKEDFDLKQKIQKKEIKIRKLKGIEGLFLDDKKEDLFSREKQQELEELKKKSNEVEKFLENFRKLKSEDKDPLLIWDIAFADVFSKKKDGFDIVIANPPYVRQELVNDKQELSEQMKSDWGLKNLKIDKRSDLYIYFYLKGLKLLNRDGIMCYVSSNSWLDVGYGKGLQEILLKYVPIVAIYDNQAKRSFKHADVNTIIAILKAPREKDFEEDVKENTVKFVNFKKSFEETMFTETFLEIEEIKKRKQTEDFKIFPIKQIDLWKEGIDTPKGKIDWEEIEKQEYAGNKWGGKYLRAPEIYWKILEKGKDKLVRLGDIADVRFGIKTGANEFFY